MTTQILTATGYEELAGRASNGVRVSLMWNRGDNDLKVSVYDASTGATFELAIGDAPPLDVFDQPFAYAAFRGRRFEGRANEQAVVELDERPLSFL